MRPRRILASVALSTDERRRCSLWRSLTCNEAAPEGLDFVFDLSLADFGLGFPLADLHRRDSVVLHWNGNDTADVVAKQYAAAVEKGDHGDANLRMVAR